MARQKRIPNGRALPGERSRGAVAVDAIALLAGVNYGSVVKVLAAIRAVRDHTDIPVEIITDFCDAPTEPVQFDGRHDTRVQATDALIHDIVNDESIEYLDYVLRHRARFRAPID